MPTRTEIVQDILEAARIWKETGRMSELPLDARRFDSILYGKMDRIDEATDGMGHEFVTALASMAGTADVVEGDAGAEIGTIHDLFLVPVVGPASAVAALTADDLEWLRSSFHRVGFMASDSDSRLFPIPVPGRLLARMGPGFLCTVSRAISEAIRADALVPPSDGRSACDAMIESLLRSMEAQVGPDDGATRDETRDQVFVGMRWATFPLSEFPRRRGDILRSLPADETDPVPAGARERWAAEAGARFSGREGFMTSPPAGWYEATATLALIRLLNDFSTLRAHRDIPREAAVADEVIAHYGEHAVSVVLRYGSMALGPCSVPLDMASLDRRLFARGIRGMGYAWSSRDAVEELGAMVARSLN